VIEGKTGVAPVRITLPEGDSGRQLAMIVDHQFPFISETAMLEKAKGYEGYLFPDTYFFPINTTNDAILAKLRSTFDEKIASIKSHLTASPHSLHDIVIMASLLERETKTPADRRIVAGILWRRIAIGMPLQVDAVFGYIYGKDTYAPTLDDLKTPSPYNTYLHGGLPPTPIDNPGLDALIAAADATTSPYLYYLTGSDGKMHYAKTFAEHQANREAYLK